MSGRRGHDEEVQIVFTSSPPIPKDDWLTALEDTARKLELALRPFRTLGKILAGSLACFFGCRFTYSVLFLRAFARSGWPTFRSISQELRTRYRAAEAVLDRACPDGLPSWEQAEETARQTVTRIQGVQEAFDNLQNRGDAESAERFADELGALERIMEPARAAGQVISSIVEEMQPDRLAEMLFSLRDAINFSLFVGLAEGTSLLGWATSIGDAISQRVNVVMAPAMHLFIDRIVEISSREIQELREDPNARRWLQMGVDGVCNSVGIATAFFVEARLFAISNARIGASMIAREGYCALFPGPDAMDIASNAIAVRVLECSLFFLGLYYQFVRDTDGDLLEIGKLIWRGGRPLPGLLVMFLGPPFILETWLRTMVAGLRGCNRLHECLEQDHYRRQ